jgi:hypothetical protein
MAAARERELIHVEAISKFIYIDQLHGVQIFEFPAGRQQHSELMVYIHILHGQRGVTGVALYLILTDICLLVGFVQAILS